MEVHVGTDGPTMTALKWKSALLVRDAAEQPEPSERPNGRQCICAWSQRANPDPNPKPHRIKGFCLLATFLDIISSTP